MLETLARWLHNETFELAYMGFLFALTVLPPVLVARWYKRNITTTEGGRRLMQKQNAGPFGTMSPGDSGMSILRDIAAGLYGEDVRRMYNRMYAVVAVWFVSASAMATLMVAVQLSYP